MWGNRLMDEVRVELGKRTYPIYIGHNLVSRAGEILKKNGASGRIMIITSHAVATHYLDDMTNGLKHGGFHVACSEVPDGEQHKTLEWASKLYDSLIDNRIERTSTILALGGGVVGDLAGFVAATYKRGVPLVQMPTTLLAQVDASVGGKVGVDHPRGKNMIGSFYQPRCVIISLDVLSTLPEREMIAGLAEVIKYGVIRDRDLFSYLEGNIDSIVGGDPGALQFIVKRSCHIKASVVTLDERETELRTILNFGHTFGHAIEVATDYEQYRHGEAVAIGMVCAGDVAVRLRMTEESTLERIITLLDRTGLPTCTEGVSPERVMRVLRHDKKVHAGKIRFVLPREIGEVVITDTVSEELIREIVEERLV